jgi:S1-C subfamily serine protease
MGLAAMVWGLLAVLMPGLGAAAARRVPGAGNGHSTQRAPGYLGIEFHDLTDVQAASLHLKGPRGVEVVMVDHDGPAGQSGLRPHDIITGLNGRIVPSGDGLRRMIREAGAGVSVTLSVFREGVPITLQTTLEDREAVERKAWAKVNQPDNAPPDNTMVAGVIESYTIQTPARGQGFIGSMLHGGPPAGLVVEPMQPQLANFFGAPKGVGLLVQAVQAGGPAALAGLHAADVILQCNGKALHSPSDWNKWLRAGKDKPLSLTVLRDRHELAMTLVTNPKRK